MKKFSALVGASALALMLAACGSDEATETPEADAATEQVAEEKEVKEEATTKSVTYLGETYEVPANVTKIVAASLEAMEDAVVLGIKPVGVVANSGEEMPAYLATDLEGATIVGSKKEPSAEAMLALNPDVILGTSKWDEAQMMNYSKVATTIPYSHISTNWKENLVLFGQLTDKEAEAEKAIADYEAKLADAKEKIAASDLKDKKVFVLRVRSGLAAYPAGVYLNPSVYEDLGLKAPEELATIEAQTEVSFETLAEWNPDVLLIQHEGGENAEGAAALDEILNNNIFKGTTAAKNNQVFVNVVDPMAQGGTAWSKIKFLDGFVENVLK